MPQPMAARGRGRDSPVPPEAVPGKVSGGTRAHLRSARSGRLPREDCRERGVPSRDGSPGDDPRVPRAVRLGLRPCVPPRAQPAQRGGGAVPPPRGPARTPLSVHALELAAPDVD